MGQATTVVLCIDDSKLILSAVQKAFFAAGFAVLQSQNGEDALLLIGTKPINAVVVGLRMPGMNGIELARIVKARIPSLPVILFSAVAKRSQGRLPMSIDGFVPKPNFCELVSTVRRLTNTSKGSNCP